MMMLSPYQTGYLEVLAGGPLTLESMLARFEGKVWHPEYGYLDKWRDFIFDLQCLGRAGYITLDVKKHEMSLTEQGHATVRARWRRPRTRRRAA